MRSAIRRICDHLDDYAYFVLWHSHENARTGVSTGGGDRVEVIFEARRCPSAPWVRTGGQTFSTADRSMHGSPEWMLLIDRIVADYRSTASP